MGGLPIMSSHTQIAHLENILGRVTRSRAVYAGSCIVGISGQVEEIPHSAATPRGPTFRRSHPQVLSGEQGVEVSTHW